ncbi:phage tail protein [Rouxiella sp. S1S-2]|uniref:phage tail sheath C-terminal domain-containing protein n=1 Tax=Rouxiella sp. S1S-2 TaxID=2653856 RepID=UPI0012640E12|nr:phage tail sheath C-terminal domain-containing protein [Rouxiella sp. S1S-2]KAB7896009.1 phage tail protein [Rouxiella sp. S1S-2]
MAELHGVETIEIIAGTVAVTTIATAVIGLVGTAPKASKGTQATGSYSTPLLQNQLLFKSKQPGRLRNQMRVVAIGAKPDAKIPAPVPTVAAYKDATLTVTLGCDATGKITATAAQVFNTVNGLAVSEILMERTAAAGIVMPFALTLSGGEDEPFPLNKPVAIVGTTQMKKLGEAGTLHQALTDINDQRTALIIVVRVIEDADVAKQRAALLAGMQSWSKTKALTGYQPRVLIATGFSEDDVIGKGLETAANKLRAVAYVDCAPMATAAEVAQRRQTFGARVELLRSRVCIANAAGELVYLPYSARAAGLRARIDMERGWWWSKSNQDIYNILGVEQVDEFILGEPNCQANLLNMENISTIIRRDGFKHWGNRLCTSNPQWRFESVRRTADVIEDSIQETVMLYNDRPLDKQNADDIVGTINAYIRQLVGLKAIFGGRAWPDEELNTAESLASGVIYINYDFGPKSPTERISLRVRVNNDYALLEMDTQ